MQRIESSIEASCRRYAKTQGALFLKISMLKGYPDRLMLHKGRYTWLEFKTTEGRLSDLQELRIHELQSLGARVIIIRSVTQFKEQF